MSSSATSPRASSPRASSPSAASPSAASPSAASVALTLVDELAAQGVTDVVVSPGSRSAPLALAVAATDGLRLHVRIDERTAAFLALGLSRGSGRPAAVLCSSGTATANYHPAVLEADAAGVPLLVLTADRPAELRDVGANQTTTQMGLYGSAVRWAHQVEQAGAGTGSYLRSVVARAVAEAVGGPGAAGPVHLNIPLREPLTSAGAAPLPGRGAVLHPLRDPVGPSGADLGAADVLGPGRRGLLVAGEGAAEDPGALAVARGLGYPVLAEPTSGLRRGHPALRTGHWLAASHAFAAAHRPDVVVLLGRPVLSRAVQALVDMADQVVVCDPLGRGHDPQRNATDVVRTPFGRWAAPLADRGRRADGWLEAWLEADRTASRVLDEVLDAADGPTELGTARDLARVMPDDGTMVVASSLAIRHVNETMPLTDLRVVGNRGLSGIDGFTSSAVGVALGHDGPVAALGGDLSIVHDLTGLVIGAEEPVPALPIVVLNNDGGGIFDLLPYTSELDRATFARLFATPHGLPLHGLAITMGHGYTVLEDPAELPRLLADAWEGHGITLIEVPTDTPSETARHHAVGGAISAALAV